MEAHFCCFYVGASLSCRPHTPPLQAHHIRGTGSAKTRGWPTTTTCVPGPCTPQRRRATWNEQRRPPRHHHHAISTKNKNNAAGIARMRFGASWRCRRRLGAIMRSISTAPAPRESNGTPWRVLSRQVEWKGVIPQCCALFSSAQHWQLYYMYCSAIMYII
jgi:hypothetical protein